MSGVVLDLADESENERNKVYEKCKKKG